MTIYTHTSLDELHTHDTDLHTHYQALEWMASENMEIKCDNETEEEFLYDLAIEQARQDRSSSSDYDLGHELYMRYAHGA